MKAVPSKPVHESYQRHRSQVRTQIILPMLLAVLLFLAVVGLLVVTAVRGNGSVAHWAEVSTIWIFAPLVVISLVFLAVLLGLIYLLARLLELIPNYTVKVQDFIRMLGSRIQGAADALVKPVISLDSIGASIKAIFGRK